MSYILDALRKADAQRERDPARGIHAQPVPAAAAPRAADSRLAWGAAAAAVLVAAAGAYAWSQRAPQPIRAMAVPAAPAPVFAAAPVPVPAAVKVANAVQPAAPAAPAPAAVPVAARPVPVKTAAPVAPATKAESAPAAKPAPAEAPAGKPEAEAVVKAAPETVRPAVDAAASRVYAVSELPADVQRELPKLSISGGVHSENPSQRMLLVGAQVLHEGAEVAPGVVLEQIRPKAAVLKFRGYRYSLSF